MKEKKEEREEGKKERSRIAKEANDKARVQIKLKEKQEILYLLKVLISKYITKDYCKK